MPLPFFGFSFLISIAIVAVHFFVRIMGFGKPALKLPVPPKPRAEGVRTITALVVIATVFMLSINVYAQVVRFASTNHYSNMSVIEHYLTDCTSTIDPSVHDRMVILRLDDVQAFSWNEVNMRIMEDTLARGMPIVAGTIPKDINTDFKMVSFLNKHNCNIEVALHGYTHHIDLDYIAQDGEFHNLTAEEARVRLRKAIAEISTVIDTPVSTFIPPQNQISAEAKRVLPEFGITHLSSEGDDMYDYDAKTWGGISALQVVETCEQRFAMGDTVCVIMLHPQEFSDEHMHVDEKKYREYTKLLELLEEIDVSVVRFRDVPPEMLK